MSQKAHQNPAPKQAPTSEHKPQEAPITGVSPDDPFPGDPGDGGTTSKPPQAQ